MSTDETPQERRNETDESEQPTDTAADEPDLPTMEAETARKTLQPGDWVVTAAGEVARVVEKREPAFTAVVFQGESRRVEAVGYDEVARYASRERSTTLSDVRDMAAEWRTRLPDGGAT